MKQQIARSYARALLDLLKQSGNLESFELARTNLASVLSALAFDPTLKKTLLHKYSNKAQTLEILLSALELSNTSADILNLLRGFITVVVKDGSIPLIFNIFAQYEALLLVQSGCIIVKVSVPHAISAETETSFTEMIKLSIHNNPRVQFTIDKSLLNGFIISSGNKILDLSWKRSLKKLGLEAKDYY